MAFVVILAAARRRRRIESKKIEIKFKNQQAKQKRRSDFAKNI